MSLGLSKEQRRSVFIRQIAFLVGAIIMTFAYIQILYLIYFIQHAVTVYLWIPFETVFGMAVVISFIWGLMMCLVIFFEWFPESYYTDMKTCPVCGKKETVKCVNDCMCYSCGATKEQIEEARTKQ